MVPMPLDFTLVRAGTRIEFKSAVVTVDFC